jgi:hypothetical protein
MQGDILVVGSIWNRRQEGRSKQIEWATRWNQIIHGNQTPWESLLPLGAASPLPLYMLVSRLSFSQPGKRLSCSELGLFVAI